MTNDVFTAHKKIEDAIVNLQILSDSSRFSISDTLELIMIKHDLDEVESYIKDIKAEKLMMRGITNEDIM
jgi:hypothetical protein